jgi:hypothetical protein
MTIKPTVGRVVYYTPRPAASGAYDFADRHADDDVPVAVHKVSRQPDQPHVAWIVYVWNDDCVNLLIADHNGKQYVRTSVLLTTSRDGAPGHWHWMPYQLDQAAKTEAAEKAAADAKTHHHPAQDTARGEA